MSLLLGSIPSPSKSYLDLGVIELRAYGLMIALGVVAAVWFSQKRWKAYGEDPENISAIALWAVPAGLIGSRIYHVATDWKSYQGRWEDAIKIWEGGLGIPGGLAAGVIVGVVIARRQNISVQKVLDAVIPSLPLAQAIGRWGNWFNQELFGRPTDLPWAVEIGPAHRPEKYLDINTFHPTFLYESLWNLALVWILVTVDRKEYLKPGHLIGLWIFGYGLGRLWIEALRIDQASLILGIRVNIWISAIAIIAGEPLHSSIYLASLRMPTNTAMKPVWPSWKDFVTVFA